MKVAVIGGGVFGCCAAYELAKSGAEVTLIEQDPVGSHASARNPGNLNPILATPPRLRQLARASFDLHASLRTELAALDCSDYKVEPVRRILVCFDERDRQELLEIEKQFSGQRGFTAHWLDAKSVRMTDARLSEEINGGLCLEGNLSLDARAFCLAVLEGAGKLGVKLNSSRALAVERRSGDGLVVKTGLGNVECDALLLASGPWVDEIKTSFGLELPVRPVKGEMLRMRLPDANITHDYTHGLISLYRRGDDEVWVGVTREERGFDEQPSESGRHHLIKQAARILPAIAQAELIEQLASLRPMAPGGLPLIGAIPGTSNVFVANGGGIKGMLLCAGVGRAMADLMLTGNTDLPVSEFAL